MLTCEAGYRPLKVRLPFHAGFEGLTLAIAIGVPFGKSAKKGSQRNEMSHLRARIRPKLQLEDLCAVTLRASSTDDRDFMDLGALKFERVGENPQQQVGDLPRRSLADLQFSKNEEL